MLKKSLLAVVVFLLIFGFSSCRFSPDSEIGDFLHTDISGHFLDDKNYSESLSSIIISGIYLERRITESFLADGSYLRKIEILEGVGVDVDEDGNYNEGYLDWAEYVGTYSYNSLTLTLKKSYTTNKTYYTSEWDDLSGEDVYTYSSTPYEGTYGRNDRKYSYYFTENQYARAYKTNLGKYTYTYEYKGDDSYYKHEADISYIANKLTFKYRDYDDAVEMPLIFNLAWESELVIRLYEPVLVLGPGQTKEFSGEIESEHERSFWDGDYFEEWDVDPYSRIGNEYSTTLTNYGDFIAYQN